MYAQMHSHQGIYVLGACVYICIYWYVLMNAYMVDDDTSSNMIFILELCVLFLPILPSYLTLSKSYILHCKMLNTVFYGVGRHL